MKRQNTLAVLLVISFVAILCLGAIININVLSFNRKEFTVDQNDTDVNYYVYPRGGATDSWSKDSITGDKIFGKIFEIAISNYSDYQVNNWKIRIDIDQDCWINNAWNGDLEIHQNVRKKEKVQTLHLLDAVDNEIYLKHYYDGVDLMINLYEGDYIIYYPNKELYEDPVLKLNGHTTVGFILYTKYSEANELTYDQTTMTYNFKKSVTEDGLFIFMLICVISWILFLAFSMLLQSCEHRKREMENQKALAEAYAAANRANEAKSAFLANMSHEIRTPINSILGMNTMILRESNQEDIIKYAQDISVAGQTLLSLVNDILDLSKIESGKMEIIPAEYNIGKLISNVVNMIKPKAAEKNLDFFVEVNEELPSILYGDEIRVKQIILNILNNAVKYTQYGSVKLNIDYDVLANREVAITVNIKDTGIGIQQENIDKLFNRFERIDEDKNKYIEGTGLGLSITQRLLAMMQSKLEVKSEYGVGSEFSFTLVQKIINASPVGNIDYIHENDRLLVNKEKYHSPEASILVIDDVIMNHVVIKSLLKRIHCQVEVCDSGIKGIELARKNHYDIIFIDHMMPGLDGMETLNIINTECINNFTTPKIILTANAISGARDTYLEAGFSDYLSKPVDGDELESMIYKYLPVDKIKGVEEEDKNDSFVIPENLMSQNDINVEQGIKFAGSLEVYLRILKLYADSALEDDNKIVECVSNKDFETYEVEVHGLKSNSKTIGATRLSELAYKLELAGKQQDEETILNETAMLISEHQRIADIIKKACL